MCRRCVLRFVVKQGEGAFGGFSRTAENQQLLGGDDAQAAPQQRHHVPGLLVGGAPQHHQVRCALPTAPCAEGCATQGVASGEGAALVAAQGLGPGAAGGGGGSSVVADAEDLAVLAAMSSEERLAVLKRLEKLQRRAERERQVRLGA